MSEADKMFEELGFKRIKGKDFYMFVRGELEITFYMKDKLIGINTDTGETVFDTTIYGCTEITVGEFQAISKKVEELGW